MVRRLLGVTLLGLTLAGAVVLAEVPTLNVPLASSAVSAPTDLGSLTLQGMPVRFNARPVGGQLVVLAVDAQGRPIGRAEVTPGLVATPIYLKGPEGLTRVELHWQTP